MNHCIFLAEVVQAAQLRYTSDNQTPVADFVIKIPGVRPDDPPSQLKAVGWGNLAQEIQEKQYVAGDRVLVEGRLTMRTVERPEGFKEKQAEVTVQKMHRLTEMQSVGLAGATVQAVTPIGSGPAGGEAGMATPASSPAATPKPAAAPQPDYDDIPF
ncbi:MAG: single-stranded DNA-binding protein [Cyanobacteria bacterium P01_A01_bin.105]